MEFAGFGYSIEFHVKNRARFNHLQIGRSILAVLGMVKKIVCCETGKRRRFIQGDAMAFGLKWSMPIGADGRSINVLVYFSNFDYFTKTMLF